jgi:hypothetical protein
MICGYARVSTGAQDLTSQLVRGESGFAPELTPLALAPARPRAVRSRMRRRSSLAATPRIAKHDLGKIRGHIAARSDQAARRGR